MDWEFIIRLLANDGCLIREMNMRRGTCGCPIIPKRGDFIDTSEGTFEVLVVKHDFMLGNILAVAQKIS